MSLGHILIKLSRGSLFWLILISLSPSEAQIKKNQNIQQPIGDASYITFGDFNNLNWKLNSAMGAIILWFATEAIKSYKKSKDTTAEDIRQMKEMLTKVVAELEHRPTFKDIMAMHNDEKR